MVSKSQNYGFSGYTSNSKWSFLNRDLTLIPRVAFVQDQHDKRTHFNWIGIMMT